MPWSVGSELSHLPSYAGYARRPGAITRRNLGKKSAHPTWSRASEGAIASCFIFREQAAMVRVTYAFLRLWWMPFPLLAIPDIPVHGGNPCCDRTESSPTSATIEVGQDCVWRRCHRLHRPKLFKHRSSTRGYLADRYTRALHASVRSRRRPFALPHCLAEAVANWGSFRKKLTISELQEVRMSS
jgi:hypothetical protein